MHGVNVIKLKQLYCVRFSIAGAGLRKWMDERVPDVTKRKCN